MKRARLGLFFLLATAIWLPNLHRFFGLGSEGRAALAEHLARRHVDRWEGGPGGIQPMRAVNPEWDFMTRTYLVLGLANRALTRETDRPALLAAIDRIVDDTIATRAAKGEGHFVLAYGRGAPLVDREAKSIFLDGEILMMLAARELVAPRPERRAESEALAARIEAQMQRSPTASGESYPNECWTFCNTTALAGLALHDRVTGADHGGVMRAWVSYAKAHLVEPTSGLLVSRYRYDDAAVMDGPEGSSLFMSAHNLLVVDRDFAREQYDRARLSLGETFLGFGWAKEWPGGQPANPDVDSGPIVPILHASAGASGFALLGASAFGDDAYRDSLVSSLELAAFPVHSEGRYRASNDVGDAVLLYALEVGPLFSKATEKREASR